MRIVKSVLLRADSGWSVVFAVGSRTRANSDSKRSREKMREVSD